MEQTSLRAVSKKCWADDEYCVRWVNEEFLAFYNEHCDPTMQCVLFADNLPGQVDFDSRQLWQNTTPSSTFVARMNFREDDKKYNTESELPDLQGFSLIEGKTSQYTFPSTRTACCVIVVALAAHFLEGGTLLATCPTTTLARAIDDSILTAGPIFERFRAAGIPDSRGYLLLCHAPELGVTTSHWKTGFISTKPQQFPLDHFF